MWVLALEELGLVISRMESREKYISLPAQDCGDNVQSCGRCKVASGVRSMAKAKEAQKPVSSKRALNMAMCINVLVVITYE